MKRTVSALATVAVLAAVAAWWQPWAAPETADTNPNVTTITAAQAGYRLTIDPATGEFTDEPAPIDVKDLPASLQNALSTSDEGLVETQGVNGGVILQLDGRFQSTSVARVGTDGTVEAPCLTNEGELEAFVAEGEPAAGEED
jgi:hypothetical protein